VSFKSPPGSPSSDAENEVNRYFPHGAVNTEGVLYIETEDKSPLSNATIARLTAAVRARFDDPATLSYAVNVTSYTTLTAANASLLALGLLSKDKHATMITVIHGGADVDGSKLGKAMLSLTDDFRDDPANAGLYVGTTGMAVLLYESASSAISDIARSDVVVIPLAFVVLGTMVSSWRLLLVTFANFFTSICFAFTTVYLLSFVSTVSTITPGMMSCILLAVSIDYSLFMLTRLVEEFRRSGSFEDAVTTAVTYSGHTILGSGGILSLCYLALVLFPLQFMQSLGAGVALTVVFAMGANVLLTPCLLLSFPGFFSKLGLESCGCQPRRPAQTASRSGSFSYKVAQMMTTRTTTVLVVIFLIGFMAFFGPVSLGLSPVGDVRQLVPRTSVAIETMTRLDSAFSKGFTTPYSIGLVQDDQNGNQTVFNTDFWTSSRSTLSAVAKKFPATNRSSVVSPMFLLSDGAEAPVAKIPDSIQVEIFAQCHESWDKVLPSGWSSLFGSPLPCNVGENCCAKTFASPKLRALISSQLHRNLTDADAAQLVGNIRGLLEMTVNSAGTAVKAQVVADYSSGTDASIDFVKSVRDVLNSPESSARSLQGGGNISAYLTGGDTEITDILNVLARDTAPILGGTTVLVLIVVGVLYQSILIPIRGVVTILLTQMTAFGFLVLVYQNGVFDSTGWSCLESTGGVSFLLPALLYLIVLGLSLDYDVFLMERTVEFRDMGFGDRDAIELGLWGTGSVISAAGLIMAIAFSGNLLSSTAVMNVVGLLLVTAVLLDTFIVRPIVTPALMVVLGSANWYPRKVPPPTRTGARAFVEGERQASAGLLEPLA
jgi:uncharacterized membrane protein YdfJ with MMPL/SSD domain